jgi:hypothetical protein
MSDLERSISMASFTNILSSGVFLIRGSHWVRVVRPRCAMTILQRPDQLAERFRPPAMSDQFSPRERHRFSGADSQRSCISFKMRCHGHALVQSLQR